MAGGMMKGPAIGMLMGTVTTSLIVGTAVGPWVGGWAFDHFGSYQPALALGLWSSMAALACIWLAAPRRGSLTPAPARAG
jgi:predicted MFS family arabinose efflux permease